MAAKDAALATKITENAQLKAVIEEEPKDTEIPGLSPDENSLGGSSNTDSEYRPADDESPGKGGSAALNAGGSLGNDDEVEAGGDMDIDDEAGDNSEGECPVLTMIAKILTACATST